MSRKGPDGFVGLPELDCVVGSTSIQSKAPVNGANKCRSKQHTGQELLWTDSQHRPDRLLVPNQLIGQREILPDPRSSSRPDGFYVSLGRKV